MSGGRGDEDVSSVYTSANKFRFGFSWLEVQYFAVGRVGRGGQQLQNS